MFSTSNIKRCLFKNFTTHGPQSVTRRLGFPSTPSVAPRVPPGFTFSFFFPNPANCRKRNFGRNFANSERKENSNSKNKIPMNSDRNFGDFDRNSVIFDRKMMSIVIFLLFPRSNEKLLNTNFVHFFEIYNFYFRNFFI